MNGLPSPLTPPDCDIRGMPSMLLDVQRLRDSDLVLSRNMEVLGFALLCWTASWHQVPAGSLPADERKLAAMMGFGTDLRTFRRISKAGGMRGWMLCSDGRLYHPVVAEKALDAWHSRHKQIDRTEAARKARHAKTSTTPTPPPVAQTKAQHGQSGDTSAPLQPDFGGTSRDDRQMIGGSIGFQTAQLIVFPTSAPSVTEVVTSSKLSEVKGKEGTSLRDAPAAGAQEVAVVADDVRTRLFTEGLATVRKLVGRSDKQCRGFVGKMLKEVGDDAAVALNIIHEADDLRPIEPSAWMAATAKARAPARKSAATVTKDWNLNTSATDEATKAVEALFA